MKFNTVFLYLQVTFTNFIEYLTSPYWIQHS